jgi:transposase
MTAAYNLGVVMQMLFGIGTSRSLQGMMGAILACFMSSKTLWIALQRAWNAACRPIQRFQRQFRSGLIDFRNRRASNQIAISSTGC